MHKYKPRVHIIQHEPRVDLSQIQSLPAEGVHSFSFPETEFTTVTAYQNQQVQPTVTNPSWRVSTLFNTLLFLLKKLKSFTWVVKCCRMLEHCSEIRPQPGRRFKRKAVEIKRVKDASYTISLPEILVIIFSYNLKQRPVDSAVRHLQCSRLLLSRPKGHDPAVNVISPGAEPSVALPSSFHGASLYSQKTFHNRKSTMSCDQTPETSASVRRRSPPAGFFFFPTRLAGRQLI